MRVWDLAHTMPSQALPRIPGLWGRADLMGGPKRVVTVGLFPRRDRHTLLSACGTRTRGPCPPAPPPRVLCHHLFVERRPTTLGHGWADKTARLWDPVTGEPLLRIPLGEGFVSRCWLTPDGSRLIAVERRGFERVLHMWNTASATDLDLPLTRERGLSLAEFSPDSRTIATLSESGALQVWDAAAGTPLWPAFRSPATVPSVAYFAVGPDGRHVAIGDSSSNRLQLWDASLGKPAGCPFGSGPVVGDRGAVWPQGRGAGGGDPRHSSPDREEPESPSVRGSRVAGRLTPSSHSRPRPLRSQHAQRQFRWHLGNRLRRARVAAHPPPGPGWRHCLRTRRPESRDGGRQACRIVPFRRDDRQLEVLDQFAELFSESACPDWLESRGWLAKRFVDCGTRCGRGTRVGSRPLLSKCRLGTSHKRRSLPKRATGGDTLRHFDEALAIDPPRWRVIWPRAGPAEPGNGRSRPGLHVRHLDPSG